MRGGEGLFHLSENLRFAQDHRIESGGHAKGMLDRRLVRMAIQVGMNIGAVEMVIVAEPVDDKILVRRLQTAIKFGAIAGGDDRGLIGAAVAGDFMQRANQLVGSERRLFADIDRRGVVIDAKGEQTHAETGNDPQCPGF